VGDTRIAAVEVENEIDPSNPRAIAWARAMIPYVRSITGGIPVAISVCGCDNTGTLQVLRIALGSSQPDIYDFHYFADPNANPSPAQAQRVPQAALEYGFAKAKNMVAPATLIVGETGVSTYYPGTPDSAGATSDANWEQTQAAFFSKVEAAAKVAGIPPAAPWGYIDVAYGGGVSNTRQRFFGIFRSNGTPKPAAAVIASTFASA
jgi:hypothetical protein